MDILEAGDGGAGAGFRQIVKKIYTPVHSIAPL